jgi:acyl-CoA dehydrogenase
MSSLTALRPEVVLLQKRADEFVEQHCIPAEVEYHQHLAKLHGNDRWSAAALPPCLERLQNKAKELKLWNLFLPQRLAHKLPHEYQHPLSFFLTHREYGIICESLGRCPLLAPEACNCSAPDTGNMELLVEFGSTAQKKKYLLPLLHGKCRSAFLMTEPNVASSDPTNLETKLTRIETNNSAHHHHYHSISYLLSGEKWWSTGAMDPRCRLAVVVAKMDYSQCRAPSTATTSTTTTTMKSRHGAHTIVLVELPHPQVIMKRPLTVFGYDDAPHGHAQVLLNQVVLSPEDILHAEGSGFQVSQARLGPGRIHHCMRAIGMGKVFFFI